MNRFSDEQLAIRLIEYRSAGYTYRLFLRKTVVRYLAALGFVTFGSVALYAGSVVLSNSIVGWMSLFAIGFYFGIVVRDFQWVESLRRQWPFREETTDWDKVQKLASGQPVGSP